MQIVELSLTGVAGHPASARLSLGRGHVVLPAAASLLPLLRALLYFDGRPDESVARLAAAPGARVALVFRGRGAVAWRLVRELQGGLVLQRYDEESRRFSAVSSDSGEIGSLLRAQVGVPSRAIFEELFTLDAERLRRWTEAAPLPLPLPAEEPRAPAPAPAQSIDEPGLLRRIAALERELESSGEVDGLQRRLDATLHDLATADRATEAVAAGEKRLGPLRRELERFEALGDLPDELAGLREQQEKADGQRDEALARIADDRASHDARLGAGELVPIWRDLRFLAALVTGIAALGVGLATPLRIVALLNVPAFGLAAALGIRWVGGLQARERASRMGAVFSERERRVQAQWEAAGAPLRAALTRAGVTRPEELEQLAGARSHAREALAEAEADVAAVQSRQGTALTAAAELRREAAALEERLTALVAGAYRPPSSVEQELDELRARLEGRAPAPSIGGGLPLAVRAGALPAALEDALPGYRDIRATGGLASADAKAEPDPCSRLLEHAAELAAIDRHQIGAQVAPRVGSLLASLTDRRWTEVELSSTTGMRCIGGAGKVAFAALPGHDRALAWIALQLTLVELASARQPFPLIYDDPLSLFGDTSQRLVAGMLQALGARTQVIHRTSLGSVAGYAHAVVEAA